MLVKVSEVRIDNVAGSEVGADDVFWPRMWILVLAKTSNQVLVRNGGSVISEVFSIDRPVGILKINFKFFTLLFAQSTKLFHSGAEGCP